MRLFTPQTLMVHQQVILDPESHHYAFHVIRLREGAEIQLFNGEQPLGEYQAKFIELNKKIARLELLEFTAIDRESPLKINLFQAVSKGDRMMYALQKAVELGVNAIYPVWTERCNAMIRQPDRLQSKCSSWQKKVISALEQSGRTAFVPVYTPCQLSNIKEEYPNAFDQALSLILHPSTEQHLSQIEKPQHQQINLLIGAEGGLTDQEVNWAVDHSFIPIQLGTRILRTETASVAMLAILQAYWGDLA